MPAFNYALLRYLPFVETGEFVNVGIVAHQAESGWCGHAGSEDDPQRLLNFFPTISRSRYLEQRRAMFAEVERVAAMIGSTRDYALASRLFAELVRPRESVLRFGELRTVIADDPDALLIQLHSRYVEPREGGLPA